MALKTIRESDLFDLDTVYWVSNHINGEFPSKCQQIINEISKIIKEDDLSSSQKEICLKANSFYLLKVLLKLYVKCSTNSTVPTENTETSKTSLLFDIIIQKIEHVLDQDNKIHDLSNKQLQKDLLEIVFSLFTIVRQENCDEGLILQFKNFCDSIYDYLSSDDPDYLSSDDPPDNSIKINIRLKILYMIHAEVFSLKKSSVSENHLKLIKVFNKTLSKQYEMFVNYAIYGVDDISAQSLLFLNFKERMLFSLWNKITSLIDLRSQSTLKMKYSRVFQILCCGFDLCLSRNSVKYFFQYIFNDVNFWKLVQQSLIKKDPVLRKQAMYLFKASLNILETNDEEIFVYSLMEDSKEPEFTFSWEVKIKNELRNCYNEIIIILEFLDEQQIHIIKPIFEKVEPLIQKKSIEVGYCIDFSWIILIYKKALMHESIQVIKWSLISLLKLPDDFYSDEFTCITIAGLLISTLNNINVYYNDGLAVSEELIIFFKKICAFKISKKFFSCFVKEMCGSVWSPEALFFVSHALGNTSQKCVWGEEEILQIKRFVAKAFKTHSRLIRFGVQYELLNSVMALIDPVNVDLENVILLLRHFPVLDSFEAGSGVWNKVVKWLKTTYSKSRAEEILIKFTTGDSSTGLNENSLAFMLIIFHSAYGNEKAEVDYSTSSDFVIIKLREMLLNFKDIDKRLYRDKLFPDHYLSIICYILEKNVKDEKPSLVECVLPFLKDVISYVHSQVNDLSNLEDYHSCQVYIKTFENILKMGSFSPETQSSLNSFWSGLLRMNLNCYGPSIRMYCGMSLLKIMVKNSFWNGKPPDSEFLYLHLTKNVTEPLKKEDDYSEKTKDVQTLWGRMNSEFLEAKWVIFEHFLNSLAFENIQRLGGGDLIKLCTESLSIGGYGVLSPVMCVLKNVLLTWEDDDEVNSTVSSLWKLIMERRKTEEFKLLIKGFIEMLFQNEIFTKGKSKMDIVFQYTNLIFADSSLAVVNIFVKHIQKMPITDDTISFLCHAVGQGLIFGPIQKKDERLTIEVCSLVESFNVCPVRDYNTSNEIRARAVQIILNLDEDRPSHKAFAVRLMDTLLEMESGLNKNKTRYFGDSLTHRIKHRLMQALLILDFFVFPNQEMAKKLLNWLYNSLMTENSQPSVKYQQEWLMIRILIRYDNLLNNFWDYFGDSVEKKTKGICSLIAISYHLCKLVSSEMTSSWIDRTIPTLLPFCMDQHFEMRLYAQVVLEKICHLSKIRYLSDIVKKYKMIHEIVLESIRRGCKGNAGKNCVKLQEDFYLTIFNPLEHYSLQTIYSDLPRLANVGSDEWIFTDTFEFCGVCSSKIYIPFKSCNNSLENVECAKWVVERSQSGVRSVEEKLEDVSVNYQKKMIPAKPLLVGLDDASTTVGDKQNKEEGLIVVASLIDRIPNLGGLARSSEIFGSYEFVINSLKHLEDKQFTSLSVTAEKWITIKEVKSQNLAPYILEMKEMGYTVIGAEQTLHSTPLSSVKFPRKSLLLLGNEKEGIPPNLLHLLDICVAIPQAGVIRSLNVHVTGALFMWEYAKQNCFSES